MEVWQIRVKTKKYIVRLTTFVTYVRNTIIFHNEWEADEESENKTQNIVDVAKFVL